MGVNDFLKCPTCGRVNTVYVEYNCIPGLHAWTLPPTDPEKDGHPATRPCPPCNGDGGGAVAFGVPQEQAMATGHVVACTACTEDGVVTEMSRD